jgi:hypothetical protein
MLIYGKDSKKRPLSDDGDDFPDDRYRVSNEGYSQDCDLNEDFDPPSIKKPIIVFEETVKNCGSEMVKLEEHGSEGKPLCTEDGGDHVLAVELQILESILVENHQVESHQQYPVSDSGELLFDEFVKVEPNLKGVEIEETDTFIDEVYIE